MQEILVFPGDSGDDQGILNLLRSNELFAGCTEEQLPKIAAAGELQRLQDGEILLHDGGSTTHFHVLLEGELVVTKIIGGHEEVITRHAVPAPDELSQDGKPRCANYFTGEMSLLTDGINFATITAARSTTVLNFTKDEFLGLVSNYPHIVGVMLPVIAWRVRFAELRARSQTTIAALERLAAGLSHELNNPAAVVVRAASELEAVLDELVSKTSLWRGCAAESERRALAAVIDEICATPRAETAGDIGAFDELLEWAEAHGACNADTLADILAKIGLRKTSLEKLLNDIGSPILPVALNLICATLQSRELIVDLREAGERISSIVSATSVYTDLDRAPERLFSVTDGIDATLAVMSHKLTDVEVIRDYDQDIPRILGNAHEMNVVWTQLIDNALEAMKGKGRLTLRASYEAGRVIAEVTDTGVGIPEEFSDRIFEPFYTTKDVGKGPGLGLHMAHQIVTKSHGGSIAVNSVPGKTTVSVRLPVAGRPAVAAAPR
jgi:signal transduction histidine kinase